MQAGGMYGCRLEAYGCGLEAHTVAAWKTWEGCSLGY